MHEKDLDLLMLVLHTDVQRCGVASTGIPDEASALAGVPEWFDPRTSCWYVRKDNRVHTSKAVPRTNTKGTPLDVDTFMRKKEQARDALRAKVGTQVVVKEDWTSPHCPRSP